MRVPPSRSGAGRRGSRGSDDDRISDRGPVQVQPDAERLGQLARSRAEVLGPLESPPRAHEVEALERLERADQNRRAHALLLADRVQQRMDAVGAVHVGVAGRTEQHARARGQPGVRVAGRLRLVVGLRLDYPPGGAAVREHAADEVLGDLEDRAGVEGRVGGCERGGAAHACASPSPSSPRATPSCSRTRTSAVPPSETFDSSHAPCWSSAWKSAKGGPLPSPRSAGASSSSSASVSCESALPCSRA